MKQRVREWVAYGQGLSLDFTRNRAALAAGGLAYFVALALAPAAMALGTLAGLILDPQDVRATLEELATRAPGADEGAQSAIDVLASIVESGTTTSLTVTAIVSVLVAVYASSKVVLGLRAAMDAAFGVAEARSGLLERLWSAGITLVGLVAGVAIVVLITVVPRVLQWLGLTDVNLTTGSWVSDWLIVLVLVYLCVRWVLEHAPNQRVPVPWTSAGAIVAALWIVGATAGVGLYAGTSSTLSTAALVFGTAVVILLWLYLCFVGLLWGAVIEADRQQSGGGYLGSLRSAGEPAGWPGDEGRDTSAHGGTDAHGSGSEERHDQAGEPARHPQSDG